MLQDVAYRGSLVPPIVVLQVRLNVLVGDVNSGTRKGVLEAAVIRHQKVSHAGRAVQKTAVSGQLRQWHLLKLLSLLLM